MEIIDYPNYLIYDDGRVWSKTTKKFKEHTLNDSGYSTTQLWCKNKSKLWRVHRLIAIHYIPNPDNLPCVNHKNCIRDDNSINNLEWVTHEENCQSKNTTSNKGCVALRTDKHRTKPWRAMINIYSKVYTKHFKTEAEGRDWLDSIDKNKYN